MDSAGQALRAAVRDHPRGYRGHRQRRVAVGNLGH